VSKGASSCRANIASATSVSISAISSDRPASLLAWPRHGISVGVGGCFLSCEIEVGPPSHLDYARWGDFDAADL